MKFSKAFDLLEDGKFVKRRGSNVGIGLVEEKDGNKKDRYFILVNSLGERTSYYAPSVEDLLAADYSEFKVEKVELKDEDEALK
jgi:Protein of unknown function (DUF2829)